MLATYWYYAYVSNIEEETQDYTVTICEAGGCISSPATMRTWQWSGGFFPSKLGVGDMPIIFEEHTIDNNEAACHRRTVDITVTIEEEEGH